MADVADDKTPATEDAAMRPGLIPEVRSTIRLLEVATGRVLRRFDEQIGPIRLLAFSPDGRNLAAWNVDDTLCIWEIATGKKRFQVPRDRFGTVRKQTSLAFTPNGRLLATGGDDKLVRLRDTATGKQVGQFTGHNGPVLDVAFTPDGTRLVSASTDSTVLVWPVPNQPVRFMTLEAADVERLWGDLQADDATKAYQAVCTLSTDPTHTLALLRRELQPAPAPDAQRIAKLIADLDSSQFDAREKASQQLEKLGKAAEPELRKALTGNLSVEVRRRLEQVLARPETPPSTPASIRYLRAVEVLERIGTPEAKEVLRSLAKGPAGHWLTREAQVTLERMGGTPSTKP